MVFLREGFYNLGEIVIGREWMQCPYDYFIGYPAVTFS